MADAPKSGSQKYRAGWKDGCKTGISQFSNAYYRMQYSNEMDSNLMKENNYKNDYYTGWKLGNRYCSYYSSTYLSSKEFFDNDLRSKNKWFSLKSDGFFSYKNFDKFTW